jgi:CHAD domain-containing protein
MQNGTHGPEPVVKLLERLAYQVNHTLHTPDADSVHDLRVAIRRFSQSIALYKPAFATRDVKKIRRHLKDLLERTNEARDCDVALELLHKSELTEAAALEQPVRNRRKESVRLLTPALRRWSARKTSAKWRASLSTNGEPDADRLPHLFKRVLKHGARAKSGEALHHLRIDGKKLRYSLEILRPSDAPQIKEMQTLLGDINDCRAVRHLIADLGADASISDWLKQRQKKKTRDFRAAWPAIEARLQASLDAARHPTRKPLVRAAGQAHAADAQAV